MPIDLSNEPVRSYTKADQLHSVRQKKTAKQRGDIPDKARKEARERTKGACARCGYLPGNYDPKGRKWGVQCAHLERRWNIDETTGKDVAYLCGPSVNTGTCHHWIDSTKEGKAWARAYRKKLWESHIDGGTT